MTANPARPRPRLRLRLVGLLAATAGLLGSTLVSSPAAHAASTVRLVTYNVNFGDSAAQIQSDLNSVMPQADVITVQEAKNVDLRNLIPNDAWAVRQDTSSSDRAGSAVMVRKSIAFDISGLVLVQGVQASSCPGGGIETRFIARVDVVLPDGATLKVASLHMPPARCFGAVYDTMANNVVNLINGTPGYLTFGADWNKDVKSDPNNIGGRTGTAPRAPQNSIDGFLVRSVSGGDATNLAKGYSDHNAVQITVGVG